MIMIDVTHTLGNSRVSQSREPRVNWQLYVCE